MIKFYCNKEKLGRDRNCRRTENDQGNCVTTDNSMSQQIAQQAIRIREEKFVVTMEFPISKKINKDSKKSCRNRVDKLKSKCLS